MLRIDGLHIKAGGFRLCELSFSVERGAYFVLLGASGAGKTLLLEALAGVTPADSGRILWDGQDLGRVPVHRRSMALVYQDQALFPHMTVRGNIAYGIKSLSMGPADRRRRVEALAEKVGVSAMLERQPETLSGGEAQRVALARALAVQPRCLLLDEPLSALDVQARQEMRALLRALNREGQTTIHVTHDYEEALALATHVGILENGSLAQSGPCTEVFQNPKTMFAARFMGIRNIVPGRLERSSASAGGEPVFSSKGVTFFVATDAAPGEGFMLVRSNDITLFRERPESSARNCFFGPVQEILPARGGLEVCVDVGVPLVALVTAASLERLGIRQGDGIWLSFKASAVQFLGE